MARVNITEEALERKLGHTARCATMTFSRAQIRALLDLAAHPGGAHSELMDRIRYKSAYHRVTLAHDEAKLLLKSALEAKRRLYHSTMTAVNTQAEPSRP